MASIQDRLNELASQNDNRTSVFDVQIQGTQDGMLALIGRLLDKSQLDTLSQHFPDFELDTGSIRVLSQNDLPCMHVATNLTGLYERPTFGMALSSELYYGTELEM